MNSDDNKLAIEGGAPSKTRPDPPMFPGGMMLGEEEEQAVLGVVRAKRLFRYKGPQPGPSKTDELEKAFAAMVGVERALAVSSGTAALQCALMGVAVGPGAEVIVPAYTWISSAAAVVACGAVPVIAEIDESLTLDPRDVERKISVHTRAIMPVHMRGVPCRMDDIMAIARQRGIAVIEDVAQANGASYRERRLGSIGDAGCFSLQFNKILTAGEGGMVTTNDAAIWKRAILYHDVNAGGRHKMPEEEVVFGVNLRMPELLAAVALVQMKRHEALLSAMRQRKKAIIAAISDVCRRTGVRLQDVPDPEGDASVALILLLHSAPQAQEVTEALQAENIGARLLYHPDVRDYHVYAHWGAILEQRTWTVDGGPWRWAKRPIAYSLDMCQRSLDLLGRAFIIHVNPLYSDEDIEGIAKGINRVFAALI